MVRSLSTEVMSINVAATPPAAMKRREEMSEKWCKTGNEEVGKSGNLWSSLVSENPLPSHPPTTASLWIANAALTTYTFWCPKPKPPVTLVKEIME